MVKTPAVLLVLVAISLTAADQQPGVPQPSVPTVQQVLPQSWTIGESIRIKIWGSCLDRAQSLRFDSDGLSGSILESTPTFVTATISSTKTAKPGLYQLHLVTQRGLSNAFFFRLTGWKSAIEQEPNDDSEHAQRVEFPISINGLIADINDTDIYRFRARQRETIAFNVLMGRNGYATGGELGNITLTLLNSAGRVLDRNFSRFLWDPYLQHQFDAEGDYLLVVEHARLAVTCFVNNCENRRLDESYQLTIGRSPILWSLWPPAVRRGDSVKATLKADFLEGSTPLFFSGKGIAGRLLGRDGNAERWNVALDVAPDAEAGMHEMGVPDAGGNTFPVPLMVYDKSLQVESETNDTLEKSIPVSVPFVMLGRIDKPGDVDSFLFQANEGDLLTFQIHARRAGSEMLDPHLALLGADGDIMALSDDAADFANSKNRDVMLDFRIPNAPNCAKRSDRFYLQVRDTSTHSGDSSFYILSVKKQEPSFELGVKTDRIFLQQGEITKLPVSLQRVQGFVDDVSVSVEGLPAGVTAKPLVIRSTATEGSIELAASMAAAPGNFDVRLKGAAEIGGKTVVRTAILPNLRMGDGLAYMQPSVTQLHLCVVPHVLFSLEQIQSDRNITGGRTILSAGRSGQAEILVRIERRKSFTAALNFSIDGLPPGLTQEKMELTDEGRIARMIVRVAGGARPTLGEYPIAVKANANDGSRHISESTKTFLLRVEP